MAAVGSPARITMRALAVFRCDSVTPTPHALGCRFLFLRISCVMRLSSSCRACFCFLKPSMGFTRLKDTPEITAAPQSPRQQTLAMLGGCWGVAGVIKWTDVGNQETSDWREGNKGNWTSNHKNMTCTETISQIQLHSRLNRAPLNRGTPPQQDRAHLWDQTSCSLV